MNSINIELRVLSGMESDQGAPQLSAVETSEASDASTSEPGIGNGEPYVMVHETDCDENVQNEAQALCTYTPGPITEKSSLTGQWIEWIFEILLYIFWPVIQPFSQPFRQLFTVGILTFSEKDECKWLEHLLRSDVRVDKVICNSGDEKRLKDDLAQCSYIIVYHRGRFGPDSMTDSMFASTVTQSTSKLEKKNVLIALGHLEDKTHEETMKEKLQERIGRECNQLFFTKGEIRRYEYLYALYPKTKLDAIRAALSTAFPGHEGYISSSTNHTVGIVSRSAESDYKWLDQYLKDSFQIEVRPIYISNSGKLKFWDDVSHCSFAILYHTKRRGRINITDVTDSLYDEEIKYLASALGKNNVIVVADDLDNSSIEERERILQSQPSIGLYAKDLILFTKQETDPNYERLVTQQEQEDERSLNEKLETLRNIIGNAKATMMSGAADTTGVHGQEKPSNTPPSETDEANEIV
ncbi:hypothetical protein XENTR_v10023436 [Xenopus tropicalis]|uniref:Uncharacterized LOC100496189 n=1 Tax=Xenopus tropicalis TaxID=8364 RepID=A0A6I8PJ89_XENTR|nr:hypothetical protein XENTR_v10023436 [Xenopus tropicalis]